MVDRLLQDVRVDPSVNNNGAIYDAFEHYHLPVVDRLLLDQRVMSTLNAARLATYTTRVPTSS